MPSIKPISGVSTLLPMSNPIFAAPIVKSGSIVRKEEKMELKDIIECAINKYELCEADDYSQDEFVEYIKNIYVPETNKCVVKINIDSLKDNYLYYFFNMLQDYNYDSPLSNNRNDTLRQVMHRVSHTQTPYIESQSGKKSFKPFVYAQFNDIKGYDQGYFIKIGNNEPQQCSVILRTGFNYYNDLEIYDINIECKDGTIFESKDLNILNYNYNERGYLASSTIFYEEDKVVFSEIYKTAIKIKNSVLCGSINKRSTLNIKTGRAYTFPTINMYTKKKVPRTINHFRSISCTSDIINDYDSIASEKEVKEVGKYIQEHCGLDNIKSFEDYYDEYFSDCSTNKSYIISEPYYFSKDKHFRMLLAYNANPYVPFNEYKLALERIIEYKENLECYKMNNIPHEFHLKTPKKIRNADFLSILDYNTYVRNNLNEEDQEILKQCPDFIYNYIAMYSDYISFKKLLGENVDQIYKNKEMVKETLKNLCTFFTSDLMKAILKTYTVEEVFKSLRTIYISEKIKGANPKNKLDELFDMMFLYSRLQHLFNIEILRKDSLNMKDLYENLYKHHEKYLYNRYDVYYHVDKKHLIDEPDFKLEIRNIYFNNLYSLNHLDSLPIKIIQKKKLTPARKKRISFDITEQSDDTYMETMYLRDLPKFKISNKKYQKKIDKFYEYYIDKTNVKFDLYKNNKLMEYKELLYI